MWKQGDVYGLIMLILLIKKSDILYIEIETESKWWHIKIYVKNLNYCMQIYNTRYNRWYIRNVFRSFIKFKQYVNEQVYLNTKNIYDINNNKIMFESHPNPISSYTISEFEVYNEVKSKWQYIKRKEKLKELMRLV